MTTRSTARVLQGFFSRERFAGSGRINPGARTLPRRAPFEAVARVVPGMRPPATHAVQARLGDGRATRLLPGQLRIIGPGRPLGSDLRPRLEGLLQADLSSVRVHQGPAARSLGALAFTLGEDVYFAPGQYDPRSQEGLALLGHELTHVLQQRAGLATNPFGDGVAVVQDPALEAEADVVGKIVGEYLHPLVAHARRVSLGSVSWRTVGRGALAQRKPAPRAPRPDLLPAAMRASSLQRSQIEKKKGVDTAKYAVPEYEWRKGLDDTAKMNFCVNILTHRKGILGSGQVQMVSANQIQIINELPPLYIVSAARGAWMEANMKRLWVKGLFGERTVVIVTEVGCSDYDFLEHASYTGQGVHRLVVSGGYGIGWFRNCALTHARSLGATGAWVGDDNIIGGPKLSSYDARLSNAGAVCFDTRGLLAVLVGFNFQVLGNLNFCPYFVYSKEDLTLQKVLESRDILIDWVWDDNYKKEPVDKKAHSMPQTVQKRRDKADKLMATLDLSKHLTLKQEIPDDKDMLKFHDNVIYDFLTEDPGRALQLANSNWFTDLG